MALRIIRVTENLYEHYLKSAVGVELSNQGKGINQEDDTTAYEYYRKGAEIKEAITSEKVRVFVGNEAREDFEKKMEITRKLMNNEKDDVKVVFGVFTGRLRKYEGMKGRVYKRRTGFDCCFSASKSISIASLILQEKEVIEAYREAIKHMVNEINERVYTRLKVDGEHRIVKGDGVICTFEHELSRENEPQLHTHCVLLNQVRREDGKWTAVEPWKIYRDRTAIELWTQVELAHQLQKRGYRVYFNKDCVEIAGVNEELKKVFSSRRKQIDEYLREKYGKSIDEATDEEKQIAAYQTRKKKEVVNQEELKEEWEKKLSNEKIKLEKGFKGRRITEAEELELLEKTFSLIHEKESIISEKKLQVEYLKIYMAYCIENGIQFDSAKEIKERLYKHLEQFQKEKKLHSISLGIMKGFEEKFFYTEHQKKIEEENIKIAEEINERMWQKEVTDEAIEKEVREFEKKKGFRLEEEQKEAVKKILSPSSSILVIEGDAGAGKTTAMEVVKKISIREGVKVLGLAPTGKAAKELENTLGSGETVDSFLQNIEKMKPKEVREMIEDSLIIVDEAGMIGARKANKLLSLAKKYGAKIVLIGDTKQFQSIESGQVLSDLKDRVEYHRLSEIRRQKDSDYLIITKALSVKDFKTAFHKMIEKEMIKDYEDVEKAMEEVVKEFNEDTIIVTSTNEVKDRLNKKIRKKLGRKDEVKAEVYVRRNVDEIEAHKAEAYKKGEILFLKNGKEWKVKAVNKIKNTLILEKEGKEVELEASKIAQNLREIIKIEEKGFAVGDRVVTLKNDKKLGVKNGELWIIEGIDKNSITLRLDNDTKKVVLPINKYKYIDYAYCITCYKAQGMTIPNVIFFDTKGKTTFNEFYVAITRGKQKCKVYTPNAVTLLETAQKEQEKHSIFTIKKEGIHISRDEIAKMIIQKNKDKFEKYEKYINSLKEREEMRRMFNQGKEERQVEDELEELGEFDELEELEELKEIEEPEKHEDNKNKLRKRRRKRRR